MEEILTKYALQYGGFGILLLYLYLENKRLQTKIGKLEETILSLSTAHESRVDAYVQKSMEFLEALHKKGEG